MKKLTIIMSLLLLMLSVGASGQNMQESYYMPTIVIDGDTIPQMASPPVYKFSYRKGSQPIPQYEVDRLVRNVKIVYPIAKYANQKLQQTEEHIKTLGTEKARDKYLKQVEKELIDEYTPILKEMTYSQGKVLIKLIDRETSQTTYELVKRFRGGVSAFFWQTVARMFSANLKDTYQIEGEDKIIEEIIDLYEQGLI